MASYLSFETEEFTFAIFFVKKPFDEIHFVKLKLTT